MPCILVYGASTLDFLPEDTELVSARRSELLIVVIP